MGLWLVISYWLLVVGYQPTNHPSIHPTIHPSIHPTNQPYERTILTTTPSPQTLLFLCTGNYYRSRFAEYYFNHRAAEARLNWRAGSKGLKIDVERKFNIGPISGQAVDRLARHGIFLAEPIPFPQPLSAADLEAAALTIAVKEAEHRPLLAGQFPGWVERVTYWHIHDLDQATAAEALAQLEDRIGALIDHLRNGGG